MEKCKCERCGRIRDLFQYTFFDVNRKQITKRKVHDGGVDANPRFTSSEETIWEDDSRGLCEECAVEVNKRNYDSANQ